MYSSTESEVISLDAVGLRMDGIPALDLWDLVTEVLHSFLNQPVQGNLLLDNAQPRKSTHTRTKKHPNRKIIKRITYHQEHGVRYFTEIDL